MYDRIENLWIRIKDKCYNKKCLEYKKYGEKGIKLCDEWLDYNNFRQFVTSDPNYLNLKYYFYRFDSNMDFTPENCKWMDKKEISYYQYHNKIKIKKIKKTQKSYPDPILKSITMSDVYLKFLNSQK